ncbi:hypothetical protein Plec18167_005215 [Paecilomyces lecythidis]|uniref:Uncharacterized protein n=1 Tax=Paecilomyces lecythidis TaxID=3004212 RepID=A0ABR3XLE2_9EURO
MRATPTEEQRGVGIRSFWLAYHLLEKYSQALDTAKRALRALNSVVPISSLSNPAIVDGLDPEPEPEPEQDGQNDLNSQTTTNRDFFDPMSWHIDDIPLDVVALVSSMGNRDTDDVANGPSEESLDPELRIWTTDADYRFDPGVSDV